VDYTLTASGRSLLEPLAALQAWSIEHFGEVREAPLAWDAR
jgi:DNA-binding HxlR family transcriptional regulator